MPVIYLAPVATFFLVFLFLEWILKTGIAGLATDHPNERSLHSSPVPRTGGLAIVAGIMISWALLWKSWMIPISGSVLLLVIVSFLDDLWGLSPAWRFLAQLFTAGVFVTIGLNGEWGWPWLFLLTLGVVWVTNLFNFMDGSDGLAGGMALFGFGSYVVASCVNGDFGLASVVGCIAVASLVFLRFNFYPARIFMGDAGSVPIGFMAASFGLLGWQRGIWPLWFPALVFSPFILDATITLLKRLLNGEKIWQAHRSHYYQRLILMGLGHRNTAISEYCLMLAVSISALWLLHMPLTLQWIGLGLWLGIYVLIAIWIDRQWRVYLNIGS